DEVTQSSRKLGIDLASVAAACDEVCVLGYVDTTARLEALLGSYRRVLGPDARVSVMLRPLVPDCDAEDNFGAKVAAVPACGASAAEMVDLFRDIDAVVHSAYVPSGERDVYSSMPPQIERFDAELANIRMAQRVYRCALVSGVRRVVVVSSNHAADWYEHAQV